MENGCKSSTIVVVIMNPSILFVFVSILTATGANHEGNFKFFEKFYRQCENSTQIFKCLKIQSLKILDRALHSKSISIIDGVTITSDRKGRDFIPPLNSSTLDELSSEEVNHMLGSTTARFFNTHNFQINVTELVEEGRRRKGGRGGWGAMLVALGIKGTFLAMAYQGIAIMSGTALIVGKLALLLGAILGLKNLVSGGHDKTTVEIVKVPKYSESHTHSYEDEHDHYRRQFDEFGRRIGYKE